MLRIRDVDPGFCPSRIPEKPQQKRGVKRKYVVLTFFVTTKITKKLKIIENLTGEEKKFGQIYNEL